MIRIRRLLALTALVPLLVAVFAPPAAAAGDDNTAVAVNTEDGGSVFRLAFAVRQVANGVIDETNSAYALASCTDCQTVALAFQVVLATADVDVAVPENRAVAYNEQCAECVTYASAMQVVLGFDGPVRFTAEGRQRLAALRETLRGLEERAPSLTVQELNAEVQAAKAELIAILNQELVEVSPVTTAGPTTTTSTPVPENATSTSTTTTDNASPTTTTDLSTTTTTETSVASTTATTVSTSTTSTTTPEAP